MKTTERWFNALKTFMYSWWFGFLLIGSFFAGIVTWVALRHMPMPWNIATTPAVEGEYQVPPLPYRYDALEPYIDAKTMEVHYTKHHQGYVSKLNRALRDYPQWYGTPVDELLKRLAELPESVRAAVRNNAGGHYNHSLFWLMMSPSGGGEPQGRLKEALEETFGSVGAFRTAFTQAALDVFGSGWAWVCLDDEGKLLIVKTEDQDSPVTEGFTPILGLDIWEHAYYLKYQNRRSEYIDAWWHVVNWDQVDHYFTAGRSK